MGIRVVHKYKADSTDGKEWIAEVHLGTILIKVAIQGNSLAVWGEVYNTDSTLITMVFRLYGTGEELPPYICDEVSTYVDTYFMGDEVYHLYVFYTL